MTTIDRFMIKSSKGAITNERTSHSEYSCTKSDETLNSVCDAVKLYSNDNVVKDMESVGNDKIKSRRSQRVKHSVGTHDKSQNGVEDDSHRNKPGCAAVDVICKNSTVEISYEDFLTENCDEAMDAETALPKTPSGTQNVGRDIRNFFSKGPATFSHQTPPSFTTIRVKAEIHIPSCESPTEASNDKITNLLPTKIQKKNRKQHIRPCIEITDDDLIIECLDSEVIEHKGETNRQLKVTPCVSSVESSKSVQIEKAIEGPNMYDVLMKKQIKQGANTDSLKQEANLEDRLGTEDKNCKSKKRIGKRGGKTVNSGCADDNNCLNLVNVGSSQNTEEIINRDDEETRIYMPVSVTDKEVKYRRVHQDNGKPPAKSASESMQVMLLDAPVNAESLKEDGPTKELRRSRRQSSLLASAAIFHVLQEGGSVKPKRSIPQNEPDEVICLDSGVSDSLEGTRSSTDHKQTNPPSSVTPAVNFAPIFMKRSAKDAAKKPSPKLSAAEKEALRIKRDFLLSGVPVELKKLQNNQPTVTPQTEAPLPVYSHTYQRDSVSEQGAGEFDVWSLQEANLSLKDSSNIRPLITDRQSFSLGYIPLADEYEKVGSKTECRESLTEFSSQDLPALLSEVKSHNPSFPVDRIYRQLSAKKNLDSKLKSTENQYTLWTEKYAPSCATEVIGNWDSCKKLRDWLLEWKHFIGCHFLSAKTYQTNKMSLSDDFESSDIDSKDDDSEDSSSSLCNTMLLLGQHGIGKTAMVYALAQELDFKVFEVNPSGCREGRYVLTQLQEATQSHQVTRGPQADMVASQEEPILCLDSAADVKKKEKKSSKTRATKKADACGGFLTRWTEKQSSLEFSTKRGSKRGRERDSPLKRNLSQQQKQQLQRDLRPQNVDVRKPSLILFDEVDNVLDDDKGFWSAVQTFMKTTKRPIILTATNRHFVNRFNGSFETLRLHVPRLVNTASYVQVICLLENVRTNYDDLFSLVEFCNGDIRKTLITLQYWVESREACNLVFSHPVKHCTPISVSQDSIASSASTIIGLAEDSSSAAFGVHESASQDSDDDFQKAIPKKRRRLQIFSDDENSRSVTGHLASSTRMVFDDVSQSCSLAPTDADFMDEVAGESVGVTQTVTEVDSELILPLRRLNASLVGIDDAHIFNKTLQCLKKSCVPQVLGDFRYRNLQVLDHLIENLHSFASTLEFDMKNSATESGGDDGSPRSQQMSLKTLSYAYDNKSFTDVYSSSLKRIPAEEDMSGYSRSSNWWHYKDQVETARVMTDSLGLLVSGVRWRDCLKNNHNLKALSEQFSSEDEHRQCNRFTGILKENTKILEDLKHHIMQPCATLSVEYLPMLSAICKSEELRRSEQRRRRFSHYLSNFLSSMPSSLLKKLNQRQML